MILEKEMATHSTILAWEIPWREEAGGVQTMWLQKSQTQLKRLKWQQKYNTEQTIEETVAVFSPFKGQHG